MNIDMVVFETKHVSLYFSTLEMGLGLTIVPQNKTVNIMLFVLDLNISWGND